MRTYGYYNPGADLAALIGDRGNANAFGDQLWQSIAAVTNQTNADPSQKGQFETNIFEQLKRIFGVNSKAELANAARDKPDVAATFLRNVFSNMAERTGNRNLMAFLSGMSNRTLANLLGSAFTVGRGDEAEVLGGGTTPSGEPEIAQFAKNLAYIMRAGGLESDPVWLRTDVFNQGETTPQQQFATVLERLRNLRQSLVNAGDTSPWGDPARAAATARNVLLRFISGTLGGAQADALRSAVTAAADPTQLFNTLFVLDNGQARINVQHPVYRLLQQYGLVA